MDIGRDQDVEEPVEDERLPLIGQLQAEARMTLASNVGVRPEQVLLVSTEAEADQTRMMLRVEGDYYVLDAVGDELSTDPELREYHQEAWRTPLLWHNDLNPLDADGNGLITPRDALVAINALNKGRGGALPSANVVNQIDPVFANFKIDTNGDGFLSPIDVLLIIRHINEQSQTVRSDVQAAASDAVFASAWLESRQRDDEANTRAIDA